MSSVLSFQPEGFSLAFLTDPVLTNFPFLICDYLNFSLDLFTLFLFSSVTQSG